MDMINLGCGKRFHKDWINVDFYKSGESVIAHNLLDGIPFKNNSFDVVYHSHVLEHFSKKDAINFITECYRILKPGGIIRIAVPDLEQIAREYIKQLDKSLLSPEVPNENHEWMIMEMYDQTVRQLPGGEMGKRILAKDLSNKDYIYSRLGYEAKNVRELNTIEPKVSRFNIIFNKIKDSFYTMARLNNIRKAYGIGKFRLQGEIHQWMYDQYSLGHLLKNTGFKTWKKVDAFKSSISVWNSYQLDTIGPDILKPDSLFMEAVK